MVEAGGIETGLEKSHTDGHISEKPVRYPQNYPKMFQCSLSNVPYMMSRSQRRQLKSIIDLNRMRRASCGTERDRTQID